MERRVIKRGEFHWGSFVVFADGSIEVDTGGIKSSFRNFADLERALGQDSRPANGPSEPDEPPPR